MENRITKERKEGRLKALKIFFSNLKVVAIFMIATLLVTGVFYSRS